MAIAQKLHLVVNSSSSQNLPTSSLFHSPAYLVSNFSTLLELAWLIFKFYFCKLPAQMFIMNRVAHPLAAVSLHLDYALIGAALSLLWCSFDSLANNRVQISLFTASFLNASWYQHGLVHDKFSMAKFMPNLVLLCCSMLHTLSRINLFFCQKRIIYC